MLDDNAFREVLEALDRPWQGYRRVRKGVMKRMRRHMQALGCSSAADYLAVLNENPAEFDRCQAYLRITMSRFFRDRQLWRHLGKTLLPELVSRFPSRIRVWSAGCACGEETYSLALLWHQLGLTGRLDIVASDADEECLCRARQGIYGKSSLKNLAPSTIASSFSRVGAEYVVLPHLRGGITWLQHDLLGSPPPGPFHLILLRNNLLTYYRMPVLRQALENVLAPLAPSGSVVIGCHENIPPLSFPLLRDAGCPLVYHHLPADPPNGSQARQYPG